MSEPTREQIKEAFKKTIERWEKIVEEPTFHGQSACTLCQMESGVGGEYICSRSCPIRSYTSNSACGGTPYHTFYRDKTPANALAELNFLRKVYIWWMEEEGKDKKEEKKEEWEDVTEEIDWRLHRHGVQHRTYWLRGYYKNNFVVWLDNEGISLGSSISYQIKIEKEGMSFRILKKT